jgi:hypothetical protein
MAEEKEKRREDFGTYSHTVFFIQPILALQHYKSYTATVQGQHRSLSCKRFWYESRGVSDNVSILVVELPLEQFGIRIEIVQTLRWECTKV